MTDTPQAPAGWYPDPAGNPRLERWWDGHSWHDTTRPLAPDLPPPAVPPEPPAPPAPPVEVADPGDEGDDPGRVEAKVGPGTLVLDGDALHVTFNGASRALGARDFTVSLADLAGIELHTTRTLGVSTDTVWLRLTGEEPGKPPKRSRYRIVYVPVKQRAALDELIAEVDRRLGHTGDSIVSTIRDPRLEVLAGATIIGGMPNGPVLKHIVAHSRGEERPWLSINGVGTLVAFDDRLMIIKAGLLTGHLAGTLGGARITTFPYTDITGIEYNAGISTGVLEILTPSYSGAGNHDYWRGTNQSRNANSGDPFTLSNTLPLTKAWYAKSLDALDELRRRIATAKHQVVVIDDRSSHSDSGGLAEQLDRLGQLHEAGTLTDDEFAAAKARLLA